ncbi:MAG: hypothetical protein EXQ69_05235 [Acidimicrobiia bacterium]|nr:hypothetical protein [Acidimicrobiia bacterium]
MSASELLRSGDTGETVRDLQRRLASAGHPSTDDSGFFGTQTEESVRAFQIARGIRVDGLCGPETWSVLVESGFALGDRLLYLGRPNLRGDDVVDLQHQLNRLGFDAGREDGILGPETTEALRQYQRASSLEVDGIAGPTTLTALARLTHLAADSVASMREREALRSPSSLQGRRVYLAIAPGFEQIGTVIGRDLMAAGAQLISDSSGAGDRDLASRANRWDAQLIIAIRAGDVPGSTCSHFSSGSFRSEAGFRIAERISQELGVAGADLATVSGRAYPLLRETRMAAVLCELVAAEDATAMASLLNTAADTAHAIARGIQRGIEEPADE